MSDWTEIKLASDVTEMPERITLEVDFARLAEQLDAVGMTEAAEEIRARAAAAESTSTKPQRETNRVLRERRA